MTPIGVTFHKDLFPALEDGTKTMTRRVIVPKKWMLTGEDPSDAFALAAGLAMGEMEGGFFGPLGAPGQLWYAKRGRFMPRSKASLWLEVKAVRIEMLQDITLPDILQEGIRFNHELIRLSEARLAFAALWDSCSKDRYKWEKNPWVRAYTFARAENPT